MKLETFLIIQYIYIQKYFKISLFLVLQHHCPQFKSLYHQQLGYINNLFTSIFANLKTAFLEPCIMANCYERWNQPKHKYCLSSHETIWFLRRPLFHHDNILITIHFLEHNRCFEANSTVSGICYCFGLVWKTISSS